MPSMSMVSMDAFPESKRGRNAANNKVKAAYGQRRIGKGNEDYQNYGYGRRQGQFRGYDNWNRRPERRTDWQKGSDALQHYHEQGQQAFDAAVQMGHYVRGSNVPPTPPPQEVPAPVRSPVQEAMPMRPQWGFESYMQQPMQSPQDAYMWTWPMQPMQYQEWVWPMMPPQQQAPMCSEAFAAAGHIAPELQGLTREQVAAVLKEAAQGLRYED